MEYASEVLLEGLVFPECPRWHDGALWFADVHAHRVLRVGADGTPAVVRDRGISCRDVPIRLPGSER